MINNVLDNKKINDLIIKIEKVYNICEEENDLNIIRKYYSELKEYTKSEYKKNNNNETPEYYKFLCDVFVQSFKAKTNGNYRDINNSLGNAFFYCIHYKHILEK